jgi:putative spermidine/putrescine transport system ATP-binding protein
VHLVGHGDKLPGQLSGGQQQRVAIARAVVIEPPLVLMDEPLSNLDAKLRLEMRSEIRRIHDLVGSATVYVTHDQEEALSMADRIVVLRDGRVRQIGTPQELYGRPGHLDVAEFMGFRNLLPGRVESGHGTALRIAVGEAHITGTAVDARDGDVTVAVRPDDLTPRPDGALQATVASCEFRGRDSYGRATTSPGPHAVVPLRRAAAGGTVGALRRRSRAGAGVWACVSMPGRPKCEFRSAQHGGCPMSMPGRPKCEFRSAQKDAS